MSYDQNEELQRKRKALKNYWAFAYAQYCMEQQKEMDQMSKETYQMFKATFDGKVSKKDKDPKKIKQAVAIIKAAEKTHKEIDKIEDIRTKTRDSLNELMESHPEDMPQRVYDSITKACNAFMKEKNKNKIAAYGAIVLENLNAMSADPQLAAKVNLTDEQMTMAAKVITIGGIIESGMKSLNEELLDGASPHSQLTEEQHLMNITKIMAMEAVDKERLSGNMIEEMQKCDLMKKVVKSNRFELAARLSNRTQRKSLLKDMEKSIKKTELKENQPQLEISPKNNK